MKHKIFQELTIEVEPEEVAELFCAMDEKEQAAFFNKVGYIIEREWAGRFETQMQAVTDCKLLNDTGRNVMKVIGDYHTPYND